MHQFHGLSMPATSPVNTPSGGAQSATRQANGGPVSGSEFSHVLASSSGEFDGGKTQSFERISERNADDERSAQLKDDWLGIIEDLNSSEESEAKLKALLQKHDIDPDELADLLADLGDLIDSDALAALADSVQSGKKLPAATLQQLSDLVDELDSEHKLQALLADITSLQGAQQQAVLAELAEAMDALAKVAEAKSSELKTADVKGNEVSVATELDELMKGLSDEDAKLLLAWLNMQDTIEQLELDGLDGEVQLTAEELALLEQLATAHAELKKSFEDILQAYELDSEDHEVTLKQLREQLAAMLQQKQDGDEPEVSESELESGQQLVAQLAQLLNQLKQQEGEAEQRSTRTGSQAGNPLPLVAQAIGQASQQLREQLQAALQKMATEGDSEEQSINFEQIRRLVSDNTQTPQGDARTSSLQGQPQQASNGQFSSAMNNASREAAQAQQTATQQQSAYEAARQAQQAIDILGPQAPERLRERVAVMFNSRTQAAEMRLDPPDLGRLNIRLNMNQEQATVSFQVTNPQAREAIEQSLPRLRELLAEQGIELADANVSEQKSDSQGDGSESGQAGAMAERPGALAEDDIELDDNQIEWLETPGNSGDGRVDYFV